MTPEEIYTLADEECLHGASDYEGCGHPCRDCVVLKIAAVVAEEREAHRTTVKMATELLTEIRDQWGSDYLWKKCGLDEQIAALIARTP